MVFDELNQLSEIPIHKSSKKFKKLGSGVVYFNDANDLIDRMELLVDPFWLAIMESKRNFHK